MSENVKPNVLHKKLFNGRPRPPIIKLGEEGTFYMHTLHTGHFWTFKSISNLILPTDTNGPSYPRLICYRYLWRVRDPFPKSNPILTQKLRKIEKFNFHTIFLTKNDELQRIPANNTHKASAWYSRGRIWISLSA